MRTTVTLDPDSAALVRRAMRERGISFKEAINLAVRAGLGGRPETRSAATPTFRLGARVPLDKALRLAGELEDAELVRRLSLRK